MKFLTISNNCYKFLFVCLFFSTGAAPLSKLGCAFLPRKRRRGEAVLLSDNTSVNAIKNRSVPRQTSRFSVTDRDEALLVLLLSPCFTSRLRLRLGALSKKKVSFFWIFGGQTLRWRLFSRLKHQRVSSL